MPADVNVGALRARLPGRRFKIEFGGYDKGGLLSALLFNIPTAMLLLAVSLPFFLIVPLMILLQDGRPVFYKGVRMGRHKRPFEMYKFRTLVKDAERRLDGTLVTPAHRLETATGRFLRETRLDELPQLINVVRGEMDLVGPRPERESVYEKQCRDIPGYDRRFAVRPGIIGYSQLFTPHSAPKRARALLDNYYVRRKQKWYVDVVFFAFALAWLGGRLMSKSAKMAHELWRRVRYGAGAHNLRASERLRPPAAQVWLRPNGTLEPFFHGGEIVDISDDGFVFLFPEDLSGQRFDLRFRIEGRFPPRRGLKRKTTRCVGEILRVSPADGGLYRHVVKYRPSRPLDLLLVHQYFLDKSIA